MVASGKEIRDWIGTVCTVIGTIALFGVPFTGVTPWVQSKLPAIAWLIGVVTVPWLALLFAIGTLAWIAYRVGRARGVRASTAINDDSGVRSFRPDEAQREVIRALRHMDIPVSSSELADMITKARPLLSRRQVELAAKTLWAQRWIEGDSAWTGEDHEIHFQLDRKGMAFAVAEGYTHYREVGDKV